VSQENVETSRRLTRAINRGDIDYVIRHTTEDVVMIAARSAVDGSFVGHVEGDQLAFRGIRGEDANEPTSEREAA
jgi:ketosteroid isomerase-like protein